MWEYYCALPCSRRAALVKAITGAENVTALEVESLSAVFGQQISHDAHTLPHPCPTELVGQLSAPALMITGWYDWGLNDALATWELLMRGATEFVRSRSRMLIAPS